MIRMFNLEQDETYVLMMADPIFGDELMNDKITSLAYNPKRRILAGGTRSGHIVMWKCKSMSTDSPITSEGWEAKAPFKANSGGPVTNMEWGGNGNILAGSSDAGLTVLNQQVLKKKMRDEFKMM